MTIHSQTSALAMTTWKGRHDFTGQIGYTIGPAPGEQLRMDDLARDDPRFRDVRDVDIKDVRGVEGKFTLDENGFQYFTLPKIPGDGIVDFSNEQDPTIMTLYYPGMAEWFADRIGAKKVVIFDHIVRSEPYYARDAYSMGIRGPAMRPHIDVTHKYAPEMFRDVSTRLGAKDTEEVLRSSKWQSYNIWRPIKTVKRDALAVLDTSSSSRDELLSASFDRGDGHIVSMDWLTPPKEEGKHQWYYMHEQQPNEVIAFKIYDNNPESLSNGTPHTAVHIPGTEDAETRLSIELRCFAIY